jgi:hypothetical protein
MSTKRIISTQRVRHGRHYSDVAEAMRATTSDSHAGAEPKTSTADIERAADTYDGR